jgi:Flp pilus assembly protein TadD
VGWFWFLVMLLPVLGFVRVGAHSIADRYAYLPHIGLFLCAAFTLDRWLVTPRQQRAAAAAAAAVLLVMDGLSLAQTARWRDSETLFRHVLSVEPGNVVALSSLGAALMRQPGRAREARELLERAIAEAADCVPPRVSLALLLLEAGEPVAQTNIGAALITLGRPAEAEVALRRALELAPGDGAALTKLAYARYLQGDRSEARRLAERALAAAPDDPRTHALWRLLDQ